MAQCHSSSQAFSQKVMANVKDEKVYRAESRAVLKAKKYGGVKDTLEDIAFGDCETENKG